MRVCPALGALTVTVPALSVVVNPTNDNVDGVVDAPSRDTFKGARVQLISFVPLIAIFAPGRYVKLLPDKVIVPFDSAALKPWKDNPVGVYEVPSKLTPSGARVQLITSLAISIFVPAVKEVGAAIINVVFALEVTVLNPLSCSTATSR